MAAARIRVGDKVVFPSHPADLIAEVTEVYGPTGHRMARLLVPCPGPSGETLATWDTSRPVKDLHLAYSDAA
jgi:hypothetical protein